MEAAQALFSRGMTVTAAARSIGVPRSTLVDALNRTQILPATEKPVPKPAIGNAGSVS